MHEPFTQSLPGADTSIRGAQEWIRSIASTTHPGLVRDAVDVIGQLMAIAVRRTPPGGTVHLKATPVGDRLTIEIRDPGRPNEPDADEWASVSCLAWSARCCRTAAGHLTEVEIRGRRAVTA
ncbi:ATP-binding protein [Streptosporangium sandarakinum]